MVRVWDTRVRDRGGRNSRQPQGVLVGEGHTISWDFVLLCYGR
jgi:hypothetical protein